MESGLPSKFNPAELARSRRSGLLVLPVSHFKRFSALLADSSGEVSVHASFYRTDDNRTAADGTLKTSVRVACQRCMEPMTQEIDCTFKFAFVADEASADALDDEFDPLLHDDTQEISIAEFIEDELILQMPFRSVHENEADCDQTIVSSVTPAEESQPVKTHNPFSELDKLLKN